MAILSGSPHETAFRLPSAGAASKREPGAAAGGTTDGANVFAIQTVQDALGATDLQSERLAALE